MIGSNKVDNTMTIGYCKSMATIWKHPQHGTYSAVWQEGNRQRRKSLDTKDERIAKRRFREFESERLAGKIIPLHDSTSILLSQFQEELIGHIEPRLSKATVKTTVTALKKIFHYIGDIKLRSLTTRHLEKIMECMIADKIAKPTINKYMRHIKMSIKKAIEWEYIDKFRFPKPFSLQEQIRYLTTEQLSALFSVINDQEFADFCLFCCYTGLRSGEIIRLQWNDINNPQGFIRVRSEQKNKKEDRTPIHDAALAILGRYKKDIGPVFKFKSVHDISHKFKAYADMAMLTGCRFHDLRHTYASHLAMAGEDLKSIQELMRHRSIASTMVYAKVSPDHLREVNSRLNYGFEPAVKK